MARISKQKKLAKLTKFLLGSIDGISELHSG